MFTTTTDPVSGDASVSLKGRFDAHELIGFGPSLRDTIRSVRTGAVVRLNLAAVEFCDSRAVLDLVDAQSSARSCGVVVRLEAASRPVRTVLQLTGLAHTLVAA